MNNEIRKILEERLKHFVASRDIAMRLVREHTEGVEVNQSAVDLYQAKINIITAELAEQRA